MDNNIKYRTYRTSINIFLFSYYGNSKVYEIPHGKSTILPGIKYSFLTILFGWWGFELPWNGYKKIKYSLTVLHINFHGGDDYTKAFSEMDYEEKTIWIYNNLKRELFEKTNIETIDIIIDLQNEYLQSESNISIESNIIFQTHKLKKLNIINLRNSDLEEIINKIKQFEYRAK
jgi:hypothetical protein